MPKLTPSSDAFFPEEQYHNPPLLSQAASVGRATPKVRAIRRKLGCA